MKPPHSKNMGWFMKRSRKSCGSNQFVNFGGGQKVVQKDHRMQDDGGFEAVFFSPTHRIHVWYMYLHENHAPPSLVISQSFPTLKLLPPGDPVPGCSIFDSILLKLSGASEMVPSLKLPQPLKLDPWKRRFLLDTTIWRGYVSFSEGKYFHPPAQYHLIKQNAYLPPPLKKINSRP